MGGSRWAVGAAVGLADGSEDGEAVGFADGAGVGFEDGAGVGFEDPGGQRVDPRDASPRLLFERGQYVFSDRRAGLFGQRLAGGRAGGQTQR